MVGTRSLWNCHNLKKRMIAILLFYLCPHGMPIICVKSDTRQPTLIQLDSKILGLPIIDTPKFEA